ncbi:MAG: GxxExxY protein [Gemmatimonadota bacterium]
MKGDGSLDKTNTITGAIIGDAIAVHRELGPGPLESTYEACLSLLLSRRGLTVERQVPMPLVFRGEQLDCAYRLDLLVERAVVVELKTVTQLAPVHLSQIMTYLRFSGCEVGLLLNFNVARLTDGLRRVVHTRRTPVENAAAIAGSSAVGTGPAADQV